MKAFKLNRREFLKVLGWGGAGAALAGCDMPTTVTLEEGKENVVAYLVAEDFAIPGIGNYYASTCTQCAAGCGVYARNREGRVLKMEGNPDSVVNEGKLCQMGQAGLQNHYNPDRITAPMVRADGKWVPISWDEANSKLKKTVKTGKTAILSRSLNGHQAALMRQLADRLGTGLHVHERVNDAVLNSVYRDVFGTDAIIARLDKADMVLSLGNDFLGASTAPIANTRQYSRFLDGDRGMLVQVESKMTLTGGNADLWLACRPGSQVVFALGLINRLIDKHDFDAKVLPAGVRQLARGYGLEETSLQTGIPSEKISDVAGFLAKKHAPVVLVGGDATEQDHGTDAAMAATALNILLGSVGKRLAVRDSGPFADMEPLAGSTGSLVAFSKQLHGKVNTAIVFDSNPVFTAPAAVGLAEALDAAEMTVVVSQFLNETTEHADLVLPLSSYLEDWGSHVVYGNRGETVLSMQQPVMAPLYESTRGNGDMLLALLHAAGDKGTAGFDSYHTYLKAAMANIPAGYLATEATGEKLWKTLQVKGTVAFARTTANNLKLAADKLKINRAEREQGADYPYALSAPVRLGMWDGRHANIPWLQEAPDQISKVVWDSWVEIHPEVARLHDLEKGDVVEISSRHGSIRAKVYIFKGIHPETISVPGGQGHSHYGRYASGVGVNPWSILEPKVDNHTGELAASATRVKLSKTGEHETLVAMGGSEDQKGRTIVRTMTANTYRHVKGGTHHVA